MLGGTPKPRTLGRRPPHVEKAMVDDAIQSTVKASCGANDRGTKWRRTASMEKHGDDTRPAGLATVSEGCQRSDHQAED